MTLFSSASPALQGGEDVNEGLAILQTWTDKRFLEAANDDRGGNPHAPDGLTDPMWEVLAEQGPFYTWDWLERYAERLEATGRGAHADRLRERHG